MIKQVLAEFFVGDFVRGFVEMAGQFGNSVKVGSPEFAWRSHGISYLRSCVYEVRS